MIVNNKIVKESNESGKKNYGRKAICDKCGIDFVRFDNDQYLNLDLCDVCETNFLSKKLNSLSVSCKYCHSDFKVDYDNSDMLYCSEDCASKAFCKKDNKKKNAICCICNKEFEHYGSSVVCSEECNREYILQSNLCCKEKCKDNAEDISDLIELCKLKIKKDNSVFWNLLLNALNSCCKIVNKGWGLEIHIVNHNHYCLKYLVFFKGRKFSYHYHLLKKELWHCLCGKFNLFIGDEDIKEEEDFDVGSVIEILPGTIHQLEALENSFLVEVSTQHFDEDSVRVVKGD